MVTSKRKRKHYDCVCGNQTFMTLCVVQLCQMETLREYKRDKRTLNREPFSRTRNSTTNSTFPNIFRNIVSYNTFKEYNFFLDSNKYHSVKDVRIWGFSGPHFPAIRLNTEIYKVNPRIQSK